MRRVIADTYALEREIGSGGGGVVYLARHLRLDKQVVIKVDKRRARAARPEVFRREVDALKNLSHTCIPQVYDYIIEGDNVCTIIDYIEGESLDKALERGERFTQAQIIQWACELLDALYYLHSRPPYGILHGDIKPSNLMVTPEKEIRLIDFNIALVMGEKGAVQVGSSCGYASPEHYGIDHRQKVFLGDPQTTLVSTVETVLEGEGDNWSTDDSSQVRLDVRSDIYSLGATLYRLLGGVRPPQDAREVKPLSVGVSPAVASIIEKSMQPNPEKRYQTAREMLDAFEHLYQDDSRSRCLCKRKRIAAASLAVLFLLGGGVAFAGQQLLRRSEEVGRLAAEEATKFEQTAKAALEAVGKAQEALVLGDRSGAIRYSTLALEKDTPYSPQAQKVLTDALGVYDLADGLKNHLAMQLPSEALKVELSPEGSKAALLYAFQIIVIDTATGGQLVELSPRPTAAADLLFLDEDTLLYAGEGGITAYRFSRGEVLWEGEATTRLACSANGKVAVGVDGAASQMVIYQSDSGKKMKEISFGSRQQVVPAGDGILGDPKDSLLELNNDGSLLAVSFDDGSLSLFDLEGNEKELIEKSSYFHFEGGFFGIYFAYAAWGSQGAVCTVVDTRTMEKITTASAVDPLHIQTNENGIYIAQGGVAVQLDPVTGEQKETAYLPGEIETFVVGKDGSTLAGTKTGSYAFFDPKGQLITAGHREKGCELLALGGPYVLLASRETPSVQLMCQKTHPEALLCTYDPAWQHTEARLAGDGKTILLFRHDQLYLLSIQGKLLAQIEFPHSDEIYDQQLRREDGECWLEIFYRDGRVQAYSAKDGSFLWEQRRDAYQGDLEERFMTCRWEIQAPLHGAPVVYDKETGDVVRELEKDSYLTYVTEIGDYILTQYLSGQGEPFGLLLDQDCNTIAYLPGVCDVFEETLLFDDGKGNLRQSRIYSLPELLAQANKDTGGTKA